MSAPQSAPVGAPGAVATGGVALRRAADDAGAMPYGFDEYEARAGRARARRARRRRAVMLAAGGLLLAAGLAPWLASRHGAPGAPASVARPVASPPAPAADQAWLALLPPEPAVVSVETRMAVTALEDRIAWIDDSLSVAAARGDVLARIHLLESERARLVDTLVRVRYAEQLAAVTR